MLHYYLEAECMEFEFSWVWHLTSNLLLWYSLLLNFKSVFVYWIKKRAFCVVKVFVLFIFSISYWLNLICLLVTSINLLIYHMDRIYLRHRKLVERHDFRIDRTLLCCILNTSRLLVLIKSFFITTFFIKNHCLRKKNHFLFLCLFHIFQKNLKLKRT